MQKYADYIKQIEIDALWSGRKHIIWDLDRQVNILSGVNGVGKSTILNKVVKGLSAGGDFPSHLLKGVHLKVEPEDALTEEEHDYLKEYEEMIAQIPQPEESVMTAIRISAMAGDKEAQRSLAQYMLPKVLDICRLYAGQGVPAEDLIGAGSEALVRAAALLGPLSSPDEVDGDLTRRIMDAMEDLISDNLLIKAQDAKIAENANLVADKAAELAKTLGRKVTPEELAREGEVTMEQITEAVRATGRAIEDIEYGQEEA